MFIRLCWCVALAQFFLVLNACETAKQRVISQRSTSEQRDSAGLSTQLPFEYHKDIPYLGQEREQSLDAYIPVDDSSSGHPAVVVIHGGGWTDGSKDSPRQLNISRDLVRAGYAVFSIGYYLGASENKPAGARQDSDAPWPQNLNDCKSAVRFIRKEAKAFNVDPNRICVLGASSGGHLALLTGFTSEHPELDEGGLYSEYSSAVSCVISLYGISDVRVWGGEYFIDTPYEEDPRTWDLASPITHIGPSTPPVLIFHGEEDETVNIEQSRMLSKALAEQGVPHRFIPLANTGHKFDLQPASADIYAITLEFLREYLGPGSYEKAAS